MKQNLLKCLIFCMFFFALIQNYSNIQQAYASNNLDPNADNAITRVLCNVVTILTGGIAKTIAVIAIVVVAVGLFMGKFSWGVGVATAVGIGMIFGAPKMVEILAKGVSTTSITGELCKI